MTRLALFSNAPAPVLFTEWVIAHYHADVSKYCSRDVVKQVCCTEYGCWGKAWAQRVNVLPSLFVINGWLRQNKALSIGHLSVSPKHHFCGAFVSLYSVFMVAFCETLWCLSVFNLIHACLCTAALDGLSVCPSLLPSLWHFQKDSCVWFSRGALVPSVCCRATRPKHMVGMQGARQSAQRQDIVNKLLRVATFACYCV